MISCTGVTRGAGPSAPRLPILSHASQWSCVRPYVRVRSLPCCTAQQLAATAHAKVSSAMNAVELLAALDEEDCQSECHLVKLGLARLAGHATDTGQLAYVDSGEVARVLLKLEQALIQAYTQASDACGSDATQHTVPSAQDVGSALCHLATLRAALAPAQHTQQVFVYQDLQSTPCPQVAAAAAAWFQSCMPAGSLQASSTAALMDLLYGYTSLMDPGISSGDLVDCVSAELAERLRNGEQLRPSDYPCIAWALAYGRSRSSGTAQLAECIAHEAYRTISNRSSANNAFSQSDLVALAAAFAELCIKEVTVSRMYDAIAGRIVKRVRSQQEKWEPADVAALLHAYVQHDHQSVVIPELLSCLAFHLSGQVAEHNIWIHENVACRESSTSKSPPSSGSDNDLGAAVTSILARSWSLFMTPATICQVLHAYLRLGVSPGSTLWQSMLLALTPQLMTATADELALTLKALAVTGHHPGCTTLERLTCELHQRQVHNEARMRATPEHLVTALQACSMLGWHPGHAFVQDACNAWFYGVDDETEGSQPGAEQNNGRQYVDVLNLGRPAVAASSVLSALYVLHEVTVPYLGMACLQLREDGAARLSPSQLAPFAAAALVLGPEGPEMVEEVLPAALADRVIKFMHELSVS